MRKDNWKNSPLLTFIGLSAFVLYGFIRTATQSAHFIEGAHYTYLSPFASPCLSSTCVAGSSDFGHWFGAFPAMVPLAILKHWSGKAALVIDAVSHHTQFSHDTPTGSGNLRQDLLTDAFSKGDSPTWAR